ncbi:small multidrug resistance pump [Ruegeria faecimaris]|uniref:Small multidrug resistance pump n=1 Tax=Ruegeria faecimaris TaxID=686389 RepID=A0A521B460_9RHOB|nr:small multidrug resistance pump [Ruegeria faecimaris]
MPVNSCYRLRVSVISCSTQCNLIECETPVPKAYLLLLLAVVAETIGTTALQASQQFSRFWPSVLVVVGYGIAFYLMALTLKYMPVGIVYAIWSGLGIVLIAIIGFIVFGQRLDLPGIAGLSMILGGILIIHLFSGTAGH